MISKFGSFDGEDVMRAVLEDGDVSVNILNYGAVTQDWRVPLNGARRSVVLGFEEFNDYPKYSRSFGIIAGRVANRTKHGRFALDGVTYQLPVNPAGHHLHGGDRGLGKRLWNIEADGSRAVRLTYRSEDGEEGYPGSVEFKLDVRLDGNAVTYEMKAQPDRRTPINLAQHSYYNLGEGDVLDHKIRIPASTYTAVDEELIPTGELASVAGTHFDFRQAVTFGEIDPERLGIDLNLVLDDARDISAPAVEMSHGNGSSLTLWTDQPGVQVFNAPQMQVPVPGLNGKDCGPFSGLCLEAQHFPDSLNHDHFPSIIHSPDRPYHQRLVVEIK